MNVKKVLVVTTLIGGLTLAGMQLASARGWGGGGGRSCMGYGYNYQMLDDAGKAKVDAFRAETMDLRKQIAMKRAEKQALLSSTEPQPTEVARVEGELFDLRTVLQQKAMEAGLPAMGMGPGGKGLGGSGMGRGGSQQMYQSSWR